MVLQRTAAKTYFLDVFLAQINEALIHVIPRAIVLAVVFGVLTPFPTLTCNPVVAQQCQLRNL